jgi:YegS/Rv2252/BmrU family lipid kinase
MSKRKHRKDPSSAAVAVIVNEQKLSAKAAGELRAALRAHGMEHRWIAIDKGSAATKATAKAIGDGADRIIVAGGDGTVRAAIEAVAGTKVPLAVLPAGTANQFASALGLATEPADVVAQLEGGSLRVLDTAVCNDMTFAIMAGTGLDAAMIDLADDHKSRLGTAAYVRAGVREARRREPFDVRVDVDGTTLYKGSATCVLTANIGSLKGGLDAFPSASPEDGVLDVAVISATGLREWGSLMFSAVRGNQDGSGLVQFGRGERVSVHLAERHRFELDGGTKGRAKRLDIRVVPASLRVVVPDTENSSTENSSTENDSTENGSTALAV